MKDLLLPFILILFSILLIVFVLFKFLKSGASKDDKGFKLTGAAAGFAILLQIGMGAWTKFSGAIPLKEHEAQINSLMQDKWTITTDIKKEGDPSFSDIEATYDPPKPILRINPNSQKAYISDILVCRTHSFPKITFSCPGFLPYTLEIDNKVDQVDEMTKTIYIKNRTVELVRTEVH
jgi:hypothetical protein